jgi:hypothetical protein
MSIRQIVSGARSTVLERDPSIRVRVVMMNDKNKQAERLERAAQASDSLAQAQVLADEADRVRGQVPVRTPRPRLFPAFRN